MKLISFSVTNFRSITKAYKIPFDDISILIGKNNEGKSNFLKALNIAITLLGGYRDGIPIRRYRSFYRTRKNDSNNYVWERDFPVSLQNRKSHTDTIFRIEFELSEEERNEFKEEIKSSINNFLPIVIKIGKKTNPEIRIAKGGRGSKTLNQKSKRIAKYIAKRVRFNFIPAIRTDEHAMSIIDEVTTDALLNLEDNPEYNEALKIIEKLQAPILTSLSNKIKSSLNKLLPNINDVTIQIVGGNKVISFRRDLDIQIDDGNKTSLEFKGDGVKSLAAMALLKDMTYERGTISLVAIEEPESHLHPGAIHILKDTIYSLTKVSQVVVTTHNPLFVNREKIKSNIIVDSGKASAAKDIKQIREILGIKASDNLLNANYVLLVEGQEDVKALHALIPTLSEKLKTALQKNLLVIQKIGGTGNLSYRLSLIEKSLCVFHVLLDNDEAGREAYEKAVEAGELKVKDCNFISCNGMPNSELEDCIKDSIYKSKIESDYGVQLDVPYFRNNAKWSDRLKNVFKNQGKPWNDQIEAKLKETVAKCIDQNPTNALNTHKRNSIDALIYTLEEKIKF